MRKIIYTLTVFVMGLMACSCANNQQWHTLEGATWGTTYHITYQSDKQLDDSIIAVMRMVELNLSPFEPTSNISQINSHKTDECSAMFKIIFDESQRINKMSKGAFDPTLAPLINLWGFGYTHPDSLQCDSAQVAKALESVGIDMCTIGVHGKILRKSHDTQFNFSAIAKGFGVDCVSVVLIRNGCKNYMIEIGGEMALKGKNPDGKDWRVQIDDPVTSANQHRKYALVKLTDCCIATSGNYRNFHTLPDGSRVSHTISAVTGYPITTPILSVTVVSPLCMTADALATACMAMNLEDAEKLIKKEPQTSALFIVADGDTCRTVVAGIDRFSDVGVTD